MDNPNRVVSTRTEGNDSMKISELVDELLKIKKSDIAKLRELVDRSKQVIMIGNGGSNSICSHISQDYTKQLHKKAYGFSDPSRLTCYINDYGRDDAYAQFIDEFHCSETLVILISSSGNSTNIIRCAQLCTRKSIDFIVLTGFDDDNDLRKNFSNVALVDMWVDSHDYGVVETTHQAFLHSIVGD